MFNKSLMGKPVILLVLLMAVMFFAGQADAQTKISGKMTMAYAQTDSIVIPDTEGHNMTLAESKGTNISTGDNAFMDGAENTVISYADLVMGSGPHMGYNTFTKGDDMLIAKWQGEVKTVMTEEGAPNTTFAGTFKYVIGAGQYENIKGGGTYKGEFTSPTEYTVEWEGEYTLE
jgi:hypothetical protein